jgi:hypothetical protein
MSPFLGACYRLPRYLESPYDLDQASPASLINQFVQTLCKGPFETFKNFASWRLPFFDLSRRVLGPYNKGDVAIYSVEYSIGTAVLSSEVTFQNARSAIDIVLL